MPWTNVGEMENLIALLNAGGLQVGLYKNVVVPSDGSLTFASLSEMPTGGGRSYARIALARAINFTGLAASQWYGSLNSAGKFQFQYGNAVLQWLMTSVEVSDANTVQGMFLISQKIPFQNGAVQIQPGMVVQGVTSGATATVDSVVLLSGTWGGGNAAGFLYIENQSGAFQNGENLTVSGASGSPTYAVSNTGTQNGGDSWIQLLGLNAMGSPTQVTSVGQPFMVTPILSVGQDPSLS